MPKCSDEAERCALLAEALAQRWERSATRLRTEGTYYTRAIWPPFKRVRCVLPKWEQAAKDTEAAAHGLRTVARGCREGWDPRKLKDGDIDKPPSDRPPGARYSNLYNDAAYLAAEPYKVPRAEQPADAAMPDGTIWGPCPCCTDPMDCGSWKTCKASGRSEAACGTCHKPGCDL